MNTVSTKKDGHLFTENPQINIFIESGVGSHWDYDNCTLQLLKNAQFDEVPQVGDTFVLIRTEGDIIVDMNGHVCNFTPFVPKTELTLDNPREITICDSLTTERAKQIYLFGLNKLARSAYEKNNPYARYVDKTFTVLSRKFYFDTIVNTYRIELYVTD